MKRLHIRLGSLLALVIVATSIYAATQQPAEQPCQVQVTLNYPHSVTSPIPLTVPKGTQFTVTLPSNPSTGYSWTLAGTLNKAILKSNGEQFVAPPSTDPPLVGQSGKSTWSFTAVAPGSQTIVLNYARPWEKEQPPAQVRKFIVTVK